METNSSASGPYRSLIAAEREHHQRVGHQLANFGVVFAEHFDACALALEGFAAAAAFWDHEDVRVRAATVHFIRCLHHLRSAWRAIEAGFCDSAMSHTRLVEEGWIEGLAAALDQSRADRWLEFGADFEHSKRIVRTHVQRLDGDEAATTWGAEIRELYQMCSDFVHPSEEVIRLLAVSTGGKKLATYGPTPDLNLTLQLADLYVVLVARVQMAIGQALQATRDRVAESQP